ncbi:MAG: EVE domain-containing protein [Patescibacteria group bacterium]|nr:EVE domain-containing protein [Patescibacteria group bacterium]MDE1944523.1 EVE domain-containing protein [Patescibacteria group bacterium]MDE1945366.1 EVE domain-containing protein [Patescibacteria group bacterium]MDE2057657.1 EVE domain-containing protein [Patescibacteria group bacterium]
MHHWLMKSEPEEFSIDDLRRVRVEPWSGVRNYQARRYMREEMRVGGAVLFYHSSSAIPGVYGLATVSHAAEPDESQFDKKGEYYDPKATRERPIWYGVRVRFAKKLKAPVTLAAMKADKQLAELFIFKNGRLSVGPVTAVEYRRILALAGE